MRYELLEDSDFLPGKERKRVAGNLSWLRRQLDREVGPKDLDDTLLLATWNIRDLGKKNRKGFGPRQPESYFYIAEVLSHFDFVAVQEVNELDEWEKVTEILGPDWGWIATDVTHPSLGGNGERLTYLFDRRKVSFRNVAGEIVLPDKLLIAAAKQFRRSPFSALFDAAWLKFEICTVHIYYGGGSGEKLGERVEEIEAIASYLGARAEDAFKDGRSLILLGDFNVVSQEHKTMEALLSSGFEVPKALTDLGKGTNIDRSKFYDQIVFRTRPGDLAYLEEDSAGAPRAGAVPIFKSVFTPKQLTDFKAAVKGSPTGKRTSASKLGDYYEDWRTYQLSDHLPLWVRLQIDKAEDKLSEIG